MILGVIKFEVNMIIFLDVVFDKLENLIIMSILDVNSKLEHGFDSAHIPQIIFEICEHIKRHQIK